MCTVATKRAHSEFVLSDSSVRKSQVQISDPIADEVISLEWKNQVVDLLKDSLVTELACVLRYNHLSADTCVLPLKFAEFLLHAFEELAYANKLTRHIARLGGELDYAPALLMQFSTASYANKNDLQSMIQANLAFEYRVIHKYQRILLKIAKNDALSLRLLEEILVDGNEHAEELRRWLSI
jgi:bacterioferritin (cytochrome b1)